MNETRIGGKGPNQNPRMDKSAEKPETNGLELTTEGGRLRHEPIQAQLK